MRLLKLQANGLGLFASGLEIDLFASQRVDLDKANSLYCLNVEPAAIYQNNAICFIGKNASGKTSCLKLLYFAFSYLNAEPISSFNRLEIFDGLEEGSRAEFCFYFLDDVSKIYFLHSEIGRHDGRLIIEKEVLKSKPASLIFSKAKLFDFSSSQIEIERNGKEAFLLDDLSIMVALNKNYKGKTSCLDMLDSANQNILSVEEDTPLELIHFFDPTIEYLHYIKEDKNKRIILKFKKGEEIILHTPAELNRYLSSGTIKGINTFNNASRIFLTGGYLLIDEIENHFNQEIVSVLIRFFKDPKINKKGANIIFTTHYSEILDLFDRNDSIYILNNQDKIKAVKLSSLLKRSDIKKSDAYQSGSLGGNAPSYEAYMGLKKKLLLPVDEEKFD